MRLCFVGNYNSIHIRRWVRYFADRGHDVHLVTVQPARPPLPDNVTVYDLTEETTSSKLRYVIWAVRLHKIVRALRPDILHAHQLTGPAWIAAAARYHPFVATAWGSDLLLTPKKSWIMGRLTRWALVRADCVTCVSHNLAEAARALGADPSRIEVAPWGVDTDVFYPAEPGMTRAQLGLGPGTVILSPRALKPVYNPLDFAAAIPLVLRSLPSAQFIVRTHIVDPDLLHQFKSEIQRQGTSAAVHYIGDLDSEQDIADLYRASDIVVSVPSSDGAPASVLEALACGALPVLTDLPSLRAWVQDERHGLFVPVGDVHAIGEAIVRLATDPQLRNRIKTNAAQLIAAKADSRVLMNRYEQMYERLFQKAAHGELDARS